MKPSPEIEAIVRRMVDARVSGRFNEDTVSKSEHVLFVGSDESEWWMGPSEVAFAATTRNKAHQVAETEVRRLGAFESGNTGWAAWEEKRTYQGGLVRVVRRTLVFELENGIWRIVHSHFSAAVPDLELVGAELTRTLSDLLESIEDEAVPLTDISGTATFLFTDVVDSTPMSLRLGERVWHRVITSHLDSVCAVVEDEGGSVVKTLGDGGMFVFDSGSAALRAAIRVQRVVAESPGTELTVRMGVHTGDVVQTEDDYVGATVAKAARVTTAADGGQILVSSSTAGMVNSSDFDFGEPMTVELKGLEGTHQLQPLNWT